MSDIFSMQSLIVQFFIHQQLCLGLTYSVGQTKVRKCNKSFTETKSVHTTKVFAIAGLDVEAMGSKTLISYSSGLTLIIKRQMLSSTIKQKSTSVPA